ncbi:MAG TPA: site-2 protease family protein [Firmicutes bacterium]|uniref:Site-2 protease family protein n=1 Tax=candidate division TA06 bacterium TaxID=2250710 RepID=A0A660S5V3_UNCT6|nr:MAG: site-2 protease family protein [candidate division TA06 bacterium]HFD04533.1 site-2 protease family protein [Bacillota bacterium]
MIAVTQIVILFFSIILHEVAHGYVAFLKGDDTAYKRGRLTLNPLPHIDLFGTILLPLFMYFMKFKFLFGWAKPVPINPNNLKNPQKDLVLIGAAGPAANLVLMILFWGIYKAAVYYKLGVTFATGAAFGIAINLLLLLFNAIPIPPLDGSRVFGGLLRGKLYDYYLKLDKFGFIIIIILLYVGLLDKFIFPIMGVIMDFMGVHLSF